MIFGHDHNNNYNTTYYNLGLSYGVKTGYGSYGPIGYPRGAKLIKIKGGDGDFEYAFENYFENG